MESNKTMIAIAASMIALSASAYATEDHKGHDHDKKQRPTHQHETTSQYGGVVSEIKDINYELVAKPNNIALYVSDHGQPVDVKGASATVTLLSSAGKEEVKLVPAGGNKLEASGNFKTGAGTKALAIVNMPDKPPTKVRFTLK